MLLPILFIMRTYALSVCIPGLLLLPRTQWKVEIKQPGALCSTHQITWPNPYLRDHVPTDVRDAQNHAHSCIHINSHTVDSESYLAFRHNTVQPRLSFRHRACCRVIALLINVSPRQASGRVFSVRMFPDWLSGIHSGIIHSHRTVHCMDPLGGHYSQGVVRSLIY